jgi:adenylylsulfate kinase-like enzyme
VDGAYEAPEQPDVELGSDTSVEEAVDRLVDVLQG